MSLSVVIVNWNTKELLNNCLASLTSCMKNERIGGEVIVVDNRSEDGSQGMVEERYPNVKLIKNETNLGFGRANNQGIAIASEPHILLLNSDTEMDEGTLSYLLDKMEENASIGMVSCRLYNEKGSQNVYFQFPNPRADFLRLTGIGPLLRKAKKPATRKEGDELIDTDAVVGAFMLCRADALKKVGGFDEKIFMYGEDLDLCYRIKALGYRVCYTDKVSCFHLDYGSGRKLHNQAKRLNDYFNGTKYFYLKHYGPRSYLLFLTTILATFLYRYPASRLLGFGKRKEWAEEKALEEKVFAGNALKEVTHWSEAKRAA